MTRSTDTLCRFGGDEFIYLAEELVSPTQAEEVAERLLSVVAKPFSLAGTEVKQHTSVGAVVLEGTGKGWADLIEDADAALYEAKRQGTGHHVVFASTMHDQAVNRTELLRNLGHSLSSGQVSMHYQPIVDLTTREVVGFRR